MPGPAPLRGQGGRRGVSGTLAGGGKGGVGETFQAWKRESSLPPPLSPLYSVKIPSVSKKKSPTTGTIIFKHRSDDKVIMRGVEYLFKQQIIE